MSFQLSGKLLSVPGLLLRKLSPHTLEFGVRARWLIISQYCNRCLDSRILCRPAWSEEDSDGLPRCLLWIHYHGIRLDYKCTVLCGQVCQRTCGRSFSSYLSNICRRDQPSRKYSVFLHKLDLEKDQH